MSIVDPSTAVIAKAKAKYGKRLRAKDYSALVKCASVGDVLRYLKANTHYRTVLGKVSGDVHRGNLENILRRKLMEDLLTLCVYNRADSPVTGFLLRRAEINELMKYLILLSAGRPIDYIFSLPMYLDIHTQVPLSKLSGALSYRAMLELLGDNGYRPVLEQFIPEKPEDIDGAAINDALDNYSYQELYNDILKIKNKKSRSELKELIDTLVDHNNYTRIIRLKKYYNLTNAEIREHLLPFGSLTGRRLDAILSKESYDELLAALQNTHIGRKASVIDPDDDASVKVRFDICRHALYFSTNPDIVMLAFYIASETELKNIITVIEGVRYSMEPNSIYEMLILKE